MRVCIRNLCIWVCMRVFLLVRLLSRSCNLAHAQLLIFKVITDAHKCTRVISHMHAILCILKRHGENGRRNISYRFRTSESDMRNIKLLFLIGYALRNKLIGYHVLSDDLQAKVNFS